MRASRPLAASVDGTSAWPIDIQMLVACFSGEHKQTRPLPSDQSLLDDGSAACLSTRPDTLPKGKEAATACGVCIYPVSESRLAANRDKYSNFSVSLRQPFTN